MVNYNIKNRCWNNGDIADTLQLSYQLIFAASLINQIVNNVFHLIGMQNRWSIALAGYERKVLSEATYRESSQRTENSDAWFLKGETGRFIDTFQ